MKTNILFTLVTIAFLGISAVTFGDDDCKSKARTGKFGLVGNDDYKLIRVDGQQTEIFNKGKSKIISTMVWKSDTEYELTITKMLHTEGCLSKGDVIKVKITSCEGDKITCEFTTEKCGKGKQNFVVTK